MGYGIYSYETDQVLKKILEFADKLCMIRKDSSFNLAKIKPMKIDSKNKGSLLWIKFKNIMKKFKEQKKFGAHLKDFEGKFRPIKGFSNNSNFKTWIFLIYKIIGNILDFTNNLIITFSLVKFINFYDCNILYENYCYPSFPYKCWNIERVSQKKFHTVSPRFTHNIKFLKMTKFWKRKTQPTDYWNYNYL